MSFMFKGVGPMAHPLEHFLYDLTKARLKCRRWREHGELR